jgi:hypothetical protein
MSSNNSKLAGGDFDVNIDDNNNIRILSAEKYSYSEKLKGESNKFVSSISTKIKNLNYKKYRNNNIQPIDKIAT